MGNARLWKVCATCNEKKSTNEFANQYSGETVYKRATCKACVKLISQQKYREKKQQKHMENTLSIPWGERIEAIKNQGYEVTLQRYYGISIDRYNAMHDAQGGLCAICGNPETSEGKRLVVDHNHETGAVRALLCASCNFGLGHFRDSIENLQKAISYLKYHDKW